MMPIEIWADLQEDDGADTIMLRCWLLHQADTGTFKSFYYGHGMRHTDIVGGNACPTWMIGDGLARNNGAGDRYGSAKVS